MQVLTLVIMPPIWACLRNIALHDDIQRCLKVFCRNQPLPLSASPHFIAIHLCHIFLLLLYTPASSSTDHLLCDAMPCLALILCDFWGLRWWFSPGSQSQASQLREWGQGVPAGSMEEWELMDSQISLKDESHQLSEAPLYLMLP